MHAACIPEEDRTLSHEAVFRRRQPHCGTHATCVTYFTIVLSAVGCSVIAAACLWVRFRFFALPLVVERNMPVGEALKKAWKLSRGKSWLILKVLGWLAAWHMSVFLPALATAIASQFVMAAISSSPGSHNYTIVDRLQGASLLLILAGLLVQPFINTYTYLTVTEGYLRLMAEEDGLEEVRKSRTAASRDQG